MTTFFAVANLTELSAVRCVPWEFTPSEQISAQVRNDKQSRQEWYQNAATRHNFYTGVEGCNPNQRPSKSNSPKFIHAFVADFDTAIPDELIDKAVEGMTIKPAWVERSLGGNARLVWLCPTPISVDSYDFAVFIFQKAVAWLQLAMLPALDEPAFTKPERLYANGCVWRATGHGPIPAHKLQAFFVDCGRGFSFKGTDGPTLPLDIIEAEFKRKYPEFSWPSEFALGSQGPSFWVPGSESTMSAIVKKEGMFTFSGHAAKPFFSWSELLGVEFVKEFGEQSISKATHDVWFDGQKYWMRGAAGNYESVRDKDLLNYFKVTCRMSFKPDRTGVSQVDVAIRHLNFEQRIAGAGPFVHRPSGIITHQGCRKLNIAFASPVLPADEWFPWGHSKFVLISHILDNLFTSQEQLEHFMANWKYYYEGALEKFPRPGQNYYLMGGANTGKTFTNRELVGVSVGGYVDASDHLAKSSDFNSHLFLFPHWVVDDETFGSSDRCRENFSAMLKKMTANPAHNYNKKYDATATIEWTGRIGCTTNLDFISTRTLGEMDNSSSDKTNLYRCRVDTVTKFPDRKVLVEQTKAELPYFLRWLLKWEVPSWIRRDVRFGYVSHHDKALVTQALQSSRMAPFLEIVIDSLLFYFGANPSATEWRGTQTALIQLIHVNPALDSIMRTMRIEQVHRHLEQIQRLGNLECHTENGKRGERVWVFPRIEK